MVKDLTQNKKSVISVLAFCSPWRTIFALCAALGFGQLAADARARGSRKSWIPVLAALCAVGAAACSMGTLSGVTILPALYGFSAVGLIFCGAAALLRQRERPQMERGLLGCISPCAGQRSSSACCACIGRGTVLSMRRPGCWKPISAGTGAFSSWRWLGAPQAQEWSCGEAEQKNKNRPRRTSAGGVPLPKIISPEPFSAGRSGGDRFPRHSRARPG